MDPSLNSESKPKRMGDFEILGELGRGGMGVVYEAKQRSLNRRVALKVLSSGLGLTTKAIMRFKREAEASAFSGHPDSRPCLENLEQEKGKPEVMILRRDSSFVTLVVNKNFN